MRRAKVWGVAAVSLMLANCFRESSRFSPDGGTTTDVASAPRDTALVPEDRRLMPTRDGGISFEGAFVLDDDAARIANPTTLAAASNACRPPALVRITHVVDGDTFDVSHINENKTERVRLIGVDTPEIAHSSTPADCYGPEAQAFSRQLTGHVGWLTFGMTCTDVYDRTLAYLHLGGTSNDMYQRQLIRRGFAKKFIFTDNNTFATMFTSDETTARRARVGLWTACPAD